MRKPKHLLFLLAVALHTAEAVDPSIEAAREYGMWMLLYHLEPVPDQIPAKVLGMQRAGLLSDDSRQYPFLGFLSEAFATHPDLVRDWLKEFAGFPDHDKSVVLIAAWLSGVPTAKEALEENRKTLSQENYFGFDVRTDPVPIPRMDRLRPGFLDLNWGRFMFSGKKEALLGILSYLEFMDDIGSAARFPDPKTPEEREKVLNERRAGIAIWSIKSNCQTIPGFKELLGEIYLGHDLDARAHNYLGALLTGVYPERFYRKKTPDGRIEVFMRKEEQQAQPDATANPDSAG